MAITKRYLFLVAVLGFGLTVSPVLAQFQMVPNPGQRFPGAFNPLGTGMSYQQYMYNIRAAQAYSQMAAWNSSPYGNAAMSPAYSPSAPMYNPVANPYGSAAASNPYDPAMSTGMLPSGTAGSYGYDSYQNPYYPYVDPYGGVLRGSADVMRAYGTLVNDYERARYGREKYLQEKIKTARERFDHEMYIKNNTPTYTEEQAKIAKMTLKRIQTTNNLSEIWSGKALNIMLDDLRKPDKRVSMEPLPLAHEVLKHINVTRTFGNLGLLRDSGQFAWPQALGEILTSVEMEDTQIRTQRLVKQAEEGSKLDPNVLKELRIDLDRIREKLSKKVLEIPTSQYLQAKRFMNNFDDARFALENGEANSYFKFQSFVAKGNKTVQEVVDFMADAGLRFAPAVAGDEAAYQALHSALAAYDIAYNTQLVSTKE